MIRTYDELFQRLSEKSIENTRQLRRGVQQRRNGMEDLYGIEFTHNGDADNPATFYVSVSPDLVYYERFAFKFIIVPYTSTVSGVNLSTITINPTELTADAETGLITPNPHTHTASGTGTSASYGMKRISTDSDNWRVEIAGVDITDYLIEQHDGEWIDGEGIYPTNRLDGREDFYDILDVAGMLYAEGRETEADLILQPEFKRVQIFSDKPFGITAFLYMKYNHQNR